MIEIDKIRAESVGVKKYLHFNNAGASLTPKPVQDYLLEYLKSDAEYGGYETADKYQEDLDAFYDSAAKAVNGKPEEIAFIENATRAWDMVFYAFDWQAGDEVITSADDYNSNMVAYLHARDRYGIKLVTIPNDAHGQLDIDALENAITSKTRLLSITHIPTNSGLVNPIEEVGSIATKYNLPYLLDACQTIGQIPVDVEKIGCTMLSTTGRKYIRGPRGTGFLWVRHDWIKKLNPPLLDNFAAPWVAPDKYEILPTAKRFENWERFFGGQAALGKALDYMNKIGVENIWERIQHLSSLLRGKLSELDGVKVWDPGQVKCGLVTFTKEGVDPDTAKLELRAKGIHVSSSGTQLTRAEQIDHGVYKTIRASVHYYNTEEEIDRFIEAIKAL